MKSLNVNINNEFLSTIKKEGRYRVANSWSSQPPIRGTSNANTAVSGSVDQYPTPGKHAFLESVLVTSDRDCIVAVNIRQPFELGTSEGQYFYFLINSLSTTLNSTIVIPLNILVRDGGRFSVFVQKNDTGETPEVSSTFIMTEFAADLNFEAQKSILFCGDSTTWYGLGNDNSSTVFDGQNLFPFLLRDKMIDASGKTHRVINKGFGGSTARDWRKALRAGEIDGIKYDLLVVNLGLNDAIIISGNYTVSLYKECLADFIQRRDRYNPKAKILFLGANVSDTSNRQMYLSVIRSAMDELVIEKGGNEKGLYYVDKSQAFGLNAIAINDTNFVNSERLSGQRVHPGGNGNLLIAEYIFSQSEDWISKL